MLSAGHQRDKLFMQWRVPSRLTENGDNSARGSVVDIMEETQQPEGIPTPPAKMLRSYTLPELSISSKAGVATPASGRPSIVPASARGSVTQSRLSMFSPRKCPPQPKALQTQQVLKNFERNNKPSTDVDNILKNMSESDKALLTKVMKSLDRNGDYLKHLGSWIQQATPQERQAALTFFQGILGNKLLGNNSIEKKQRAMQALSLLERSNRSALRSSIHGDSSESRLRHLRLLTPQTRSSKWMYQTWHHLPTHRDTDAVNNRSAIYTQPQKLQHRHWTIHPDWP